MRLLLVLSLLWFAPDGRAGSSTAPKVTICLSPPTIEATPSSVADAAEAIRSTYGALLTSPKIVVKSLSSRVPSAARDEAREAGCGLVLLTSFKHLRTSGSRGWLKKAVLGGAMQAGATTAGSEVGSSVAGKVGGATGRVLGSAANGATSAVTRTAAATLYAPAISIRDEVTLHTMLEASDGARIVDRTDKRRATADGEDLVTILAQQAAEEVAAAVLRR